MGCILNWKYLFLFICLRFFFFFGSGGVSVAVRRPGGTACRLLGHSLQLWGYNNQEIMRTEEGKDVYSHSTQCLQPWLQNKCRWTVGGKGIAITSFSVLNLWEEIHFHPFDVFTSISCGARCWTILPPWCGSKLTSVQFDKVKVSV